MSDLGEALRTAAAAEKAEGEAAVTDALVALVDELESWRRDKDTLDEGLKTVNEKIKDLSEQRIPAEMAKRNLHNFGLRDGRTVYLTTKSHVSTKAEMGGQLMIWLKANGHGGLITQHVHPMTLKAWVGEQQDAKQPIPTELLNVYDQTTVGIRNSSKKAKAS